MWLPSLGGGRARRTEWLGCPPWWPNETFSSVVDLFHYLNFILFFFCDTTNWSKYYGPVSLPVWSFILYKQVSEPGSYINSPGGLNHQTELLLLCWWLTRLVGPGHRKREQRRSEAWAPRSQVHRVGVHQSHRPFEAQGHKWGGWAGTGSGGVLKERGLTRVFVLRPPSCGHSITQREVPKPGRCNRNETQNDFKSPMLS